MVGEQGHVTHTGSREVHDFEDDGSLLRDPRGGGDAREELTLGSERIQFLHVQYPEKDSAISST